MIISSDDYISHYGIKRKSGRYPWGSGANPYQRSMSFFQYVDKLLGEGLSQSEVAKGIMKEDGTPMTVRELKATRSLATNERRAGRIAQIEIWAAKGMSNAEMGRRLGVSEPTVRNLRKPGEKDKQHRTENVANMLKDEVAAKKYVDVGAGTEHHIGIAQNQLSNALHLLKADGYEVINVQIPQLGMGGDQKTRTSVLAPPGTKYSDIASDVSQVKLIGSFSEDNGRSVLHTHPPLPVDSKRIQVRYAEDGGDKEDGVIYVRPGVKDLDMGGNRYGQVRIMVDGTHYLKGMAIYKTDLPKGVDLQFNTNKSNTGNKLDAMKAIEDDPDNPFGSLVRQIVRKNPDGSETVTSAMNIIGLKEGSGVEGAWDTWSSNLSTQMLSKQTPKLAREQLDLTYERRKDELKEIQSLTNPAVRKVLLDAFADEVDSSAVHMKAAAMPKQATKVILPMNSLKDSEIYAPTFAQGTKVALVRYPHGGIFEIPELIVNNSHAPAKRIMGNAQDAVGINSNVAARLSGADFDGDTVLVIPNDANRIKTAPALEGLKGFDPQQMYPGYEGMRRVMTKASTQAHMGKVSNLITDMTIKGASDEELAAAVRHSMVVIDAAKHGLNYAQSEIDNNIKALKKKYQGSAQAGAATLISRAKKPTVIPKAPPRYAQDGGPIDPATGRKMYGEPETYVNRDGVTITKTRKVSAIEAVDDAHALSSGTRMESIYADHSNRLRNLADQARKISLGTEPIKYSRSASLAYAPEVSTLAAKLRLAQSNSPLERRAQAMAGGIVALKKQSNPDLERGEIKKLEVAALAEMRSRLGAKKTAIEITPKEWQAIQAGAISDYRTKQILKHTNVDVVKQYATPRDVPVMSASKIARAKALMNSDSYTLDEIARVLGVSVSTLTKHV